MKLIICLLVFPFGAVAEVVGFLSLFIGEAFKDGQKRAREFGKSLERDIKSK